MATGTGVGKQKLPLVRSVGVQAIKGCADCLSTQKTVLSGLCRYCSKCGDHCACK